MGTSERTVDVSGTVRWWFDGRKHRVDGPAVEYTDGTRMWMRDGCLHRDGGPAVERLNGTSEWLVDGRLHRVDGPAFVGVGGVRKWFLGGVEVSEADCAVSAAEPGGVRDVALELFRAGIGLVDAIAAARRLT